MSEMEPDQLVIGTRGSALALWQAEHVAALLRSAHPGLSVRLEVIETKGDKILDVALSKIGDKGLFTKELENALLERRADVAVHSLKDMQTVLPERLTLAAITEREVPEDALVAEHGMTIDALPQGARVATGSLRRRAQLLAHRPDLQIVEVRGNVGTRLGKYRDAGWEGMILAHAGLARLGFAGEIAEVISPQKMIPAVGQGALGLEAREGDERTLALLRAIEHPPTRLSSELERAFLRHLEGGCQAPIGAYATLHVVEEEVDLYDVELIGLIASVDGVAVVRGSRSGQVRYGDPDAGAMGRDLAEEMLGRGGAQILENIDRESSGGTL